MSVNFELFEVITQATGEVIFSAFVRDENAYRIAKDVTGRFKKKFIKIMNGEYKHTYLDKNTEKSVNYHIHEDNPIANLRKYSQDCSSFSHTKANLSPSNIKHQFTLHFYGIDYNMSKGMEPRAAHRANDFFYELGKISQIKIATNNYLDKKPEEFITAEAASLKLDMYSSVSMVDFKIVLKQLLDDIENNILSTEFILGNRYSMYKKLLKTFEGLSRFKNLDLLVVAVDDKEYRLKDFEDISELSSNIYGNSIDGEMIIQSVHDYYRDENFDGLIVDTLNFSQITTWKYPKNEALSKLLHRAKGEKVKLYGETAKETIRFLESVEFLRNEFYILDEEKIALKHDSLEVDDKKIIIDWE